MIKAIETRYKGYRFRSRLEARWAVFFDALGYDWEYEPEGFDLGEQGWYLPDFKIHNLDVWVEVKHSIDCNMVNVYLAGKIKKNCWRHSIASMRGAENEFRSAFEWESISARDNPGVNITGPFFMGCDHGCSHGESTHGQALSGCAEASYDVPQNWDWRKNVIKNCKRAIYRSDVIFVWVDDLTCYGTLVEAGLAHAAGKKIYMAVCSTQAHRLEDVWFLRGMSEKFGVFNSAKDAFDSFFDREPWVDEYRKVQSVARATKMNSLIVGGDPMKKSAWGHKHPMMKMFYDKNFEQAATKARSARFEHGEKP